MRILVGFEFPRRHHHCRPLNRTAWPNSSSLFQFSLSTVYKIVGASNNECVHRIDFSPSGRVLHLYYTYDIFCVIYVGIRCRRAHANRHLWRPNRFWFWRRLHFLYPPGSLISLDFKEIWAEVASLIPGDIVILHQHCYYLLTPLSCWTSFLPRIQFNIVPVSRFQDYATRLGITQRGLEWRLPNIPLSYAGTANVIFFVIFSEKVIHSIFFNENCSTKIKFYEKKNVIFFVRKTKTKFGWITLSLTITEKITFAVPAHTVVLRSNPCICVKDRVSNLFGVFVKWEWNGNRVEMYAQWNLRFRWIQLRCTRHLGKVKQSAIVIARDSIRNR